MARIRERWWDEIRGLLSLLAFVLGIGFIFQSLEIGILITAALGVHELGHILAISLFGIDWEVGFGVTGAWTITPKEQRAALSHFHNGVIHLAGPLANQLYALLAAAAQWAFGWQPDYWLRLANLSAIVGLLNALPIGRLSDGGKTIERIFSSLDERAERWLLPAPLLWLLSILWLALVMPYNWTGILAFAVVGLWFVLGLLRESLRDDPADAASPRAMTRNQGFLLASYMVILLSASTATVLLTPAWLTEQHIAGMLRGWRGNLVRPLLSVLNQMFETLRDFFPRG